MIPAFKSVTDDSRGSSRDGPRSYRKLGMKSMLRGTRCDYLDHTTVHDGNQVDRQKQCSGPSVDHTSLHYIRHHNYGHSHNRSVASHILLTPLMLSLPRIFDDAPVAHLTPPSWCPAEGAVLVDPGGDRSGMVRLCVVILSLIHI